MRVGQRPVTIRHRRLLPCKRRTGGQSPAFPLLRDRRRDRHLDERAEERNQAKRPQAEVPSPLHPLVNSESRHSTIRVSAMQYCVPALSLPTIFLFVSCHTDRQEVGTELDTSLTLAAG